MKTRLTAYIRERSIPTTLCGIFYACLCVFSIVVGIYYIIAGAVDNGLFRTEMSAESAAWLTAILPMSITTFFGIVTFVVGIAQGVSAYSLLAGKRKLGWGFALGFTVFSLISCSSKLFITITFFPVMKILAYILVLIALCLKCTRKNFISRSPKE